MHLKMRACLPRAARAPRGPAKEGQTSDLLNQDWSSVRAFDDLRGFGEICLWI